MSKLKLLIVSPAFPPLNTIGAMRPYSWAKYWSAKGCEVSVLTTKKHPLEGPIDPNFDFIPISDVAIREVPFLPVRSRADACTEAGLHPQHYGSLAVAIRDIRKRLGIGTLLGARDLWVLPAFRAGVKMHKASNFHALVSSYGPPSAHLVAGLLQMRLQIPWIADYRDLWTDDQFGLASGVFRAVQARLESFFVSRASALTVISSPLAAKLRDRFFVSVNVVENGFDIDDLPSDHIPSPFPQDGKKRLVYTGTLRDGKQDVSPLFQAITLLRDESPLLLERLEVLFYGLNLGSLTQLVELYELSDVVKIPGFVYRDRALLAQKHANCLLFCDWEDVNYPGIFTGKIYEYLFSGTQILALGPNEESEAGKLLRNSMASIYYGKSAVEIAELLRNLVADRLPEPQINWDVLERRTRESQAEQMLKIIQSAIRKTQ